VPASIDELTGDDEAIIRAAGGQWRTAARQVIAASCGLAVLVLAFLGYGIWRGHVEAIEDISLDTRNLARVAAAHAGEVIGAVDLNMATTEQVFRRFPSGRPASGEEIDWLLRGRLRLNPYIRSLRVVDREGIESHEATLYQSRLGSFQADREFFIWHRDHASTGLHVSPPLLSRTRGVKYIPLSRRLATADGSFDGVIVAALEPRFLQDFYTSVDTGQHGLIALFLRDGTLLARGPHLDELVGKSFADSLLFRNHLPAADQGSFRQASHTDGVNRVFGYATVPGTNLVITAAFGEEEMLAGWRHQTTNTVVAAAIFLLALAALTALVLRQLHRQDSLGKVLARGEARYRRLLETANEGIWKIDAQQRTVLVNARMCEMLGYAQAELIGRNPIEFVIEADRDYSNEMIQRRLREGRLASYDLRYRRKDGSTLHTITSVTSTHDEQGNDTGALAMLTDITERAQAQAAVNHNLKQLEALHAMDKAILEAQSSEQIATIGLRYVGEFVPFWGATVLAFDFPANQAVVLNLTQQRDMAYDPGALLTLDDYGREDIALLKTGRACMVEDLESLPRRSAALEDLRAKGMRSYVRIPLLAEGELVGSMNLGSDTTGAYPVEAVAIARTFADQLAIALRQSNLRQQVALQAANLEQRVVERTAQLEAVNQELEAFSYTVSHDLRAPARHVAGFAAILLEQSGSLDGETVELVKRIDKAGRRMSTLIDDLLGLARTSTQPVQAVAFDMRQLVLDVAEEAAPLATHAISWKIGVLPQAWGDPSLIHVVLQNLLGNAIKYSSRREHPEIEVAAFETEAGTGYLVRDNGAGFDMKYAAKLFGVFSRLHSEREFEGTGIGLATVRRIINRHGGRVWAESAPDQGATFCFSLPKPPAKARDKQAPSAAVLTQ